MLDVSIAYNRYKFLGHEFLTWLWFIMDVDPACILKAESDMVSLEVDNRIVLENSFDNRIENIRIKGDEAGFEEAKLSLQKGGVVTELNFSLKTGDHEWKFNIKGESLNISSLKSPETGKIEPQKRAHFPLLAAGLASESKNSKLPYGRRFPAACGGELQKKEDIEGAVLEKIYLYEKVVLLVENLYKQFIRIRVSSKWKNETIPLIKKWIKS